MLDFYKTKSPGVEPGCVFDAWGDWGICEAGKKTRRRPKLASDGGECEGEETEMEEGCTEVSMVMMVVFEITFMLTVFFKQLVGGSGQCRVHFWGKFG